ncbi:MAG: hypothetical protein DWQ01_04565 [Planctomycetota bacterium]|nr:MAG: hypothetical protein DWQ01_04565 [Planctomycetota bacterium]
MFIRPFDPREFMLESFPKPGLRARLSTLLLVAAGGLLASSSSFAQEVQAILDLDGQGGFFDHPYPSDVRRDVQGGLRLDGFPNPNSLLIVDHLADVVMQDNQGWGVAAPMYLAFDGPMQGSALPLDPRAYLSLSSGVQLVDVDPASPVRGQRLPIRVNFRLAADSYRPANLLEVLPVQGFDLRENNHYALVVTDDAPVPSGFQWKVLPALGQVLQGQDPGGQFGPAAAALYPLVSQQWQVDGLDPNRIVAASVFRTGVPTAPLKDYAQRVAQWQAPVVDGPLVVTREYPSYYVLETTWQVPQFQSGSIPYFTPAEGGVFQVDASGEPQPQHYRTAPMVVCIPKGTMPAQGFPLLFYINGTGGFASQVFARGELDPVTMERKVGEGPSEIAAERGWASSGMGAHLAPEHAGLASAGGYIVYNVFNPRAMRDNFKQLVLENLLYRRLLLQLAINPALCPLTDASAAADGQIRFDPSMQVVMGQSLGSYLSGMLAAVDPMAFQGAILTGAGGSWVEFARGPRDPISLQEVLETLLFALPPGEELDIWHPLFTLVETALGGSNNVHYVDEILRQTDAGRPAPHVFVIQGYHDLQVPDNLQRALLLGLGVDFAGSEVGPYPGGQVLPAMLMAGAQQWNFPVALNLPVPNHGARTAVVVRYLQDALQHGHYVTFQLEEPKHQYGCFLETLLSRGFPEIPQGGLQGDPCP